MEREIRQRTQWQPISNVVLPNFTMECAGARNRQVYLDTTVIASLLTKSKMESPIRIHTARLNVPDQTQRNSDVFDPRGRIKSVSNTGNEGYKRKGTSPAFQIISDHTNWHILLDTDALDRKAHNVEGMQPNEAYRVLLNSTLRKALHRTILQDKLTPEMYGNFNYFIRAIGVNVALAALGDFSAAEYSIALYIGRLAAALAIANIVANGQQDIHNSIRSIASHRVYNRRTGVGLLLPALPIEQYLSAAVFLQTKGKRLIK